MFLFGHILTGNALVQGHPFTAPHGREFSDVADWLRMCCGAVDAMSLQPLLGINFPMSGIPPCPSAGRPPFQGFCTGVPHVPGEFHFMSASAL